MRSAFAFACLRDGHGAGLGRFPSGFNPFFVLFGVGGTEHGRAEVFGRQGSGGEVRVKDGLIVEAFGEVAEGHHAAVEEGVLGLGRLFPELLGAHDIAIFVLNVSLDGRAVDESTFSEVEAGEAESIYVGVGLGGRDFTRCEGGKDACERDLDGCGVLEEGDFDAVFRRRRRRLLGAFGHAIGSAVMEVKEAVILFPDAMGAALNSIGAKLTALFWHGFFPLISVL